MHDALMAGLELRHASAGGDPEALASTLDAIEVAAKRLAAREQASFESVLRGDDPVPQEAYYGERSSLVHRQVSHQIGQKPICVVTHSTPSMAAYVDISAENQSGYAAAWGYHFFQYRGLLTGRDFMNPASDHPVHRYGLFWQKTRAVQEALAQPGPAGSGPLCEWVMWVDGDTLFTNFAEPVEALIARYPGVGAILAREQSWGSANLINAGVFLVHNSAAGHAFIDGVVGLFPIYKDGKGWGDQDAVHHYALNMPYAATRGLTWDQVADRVRDDIAVAPARDFDSFYHEPCSHDVVEGYWHPGDFLAHFAGMSLRSRVVEMRAVLRRLARGEGQS